MQSIGSICLSFNQHQTKQLQTQEMHCENAIFVFVGQSHCVQFTFVKFASVICKLSSTATDGRLANGSRQIRRNLLRHSRSLAHDPPPPSPYPFMARQMILYFLVFILWHSGCRQRTAATTVQMKRDKTQVYIEYYINTATITAISPTGRLFYRRRPLDAINEKTKMKRNTKIEI